jgi:phosphoenolpyruvate carboxylase
MHDILEEEHNSLFIHLVDDLINKISVFGLFFATLDIRQESTIHSKLIEKVIAEENVMDVEAYKKMNEEEKLEVLSHISNPATLERYEGLEKDCLQSIDAIQRIQENNGEQGCNRYIISQCQSALHIMEVYALFTLGGWQEEIISVDIVPLFETVKDLENADGVMKKLYENDLYKTHLQHRGQKQTIMLGFSDGTKDGGYLMANWGIYKAKERLTKISEQYGIDVVFFDGRGGPPSRGGGKTHKFYASMGENIANKEIQVTVQGQTISSSFGTVDAAKYNIEQLLSAGLANGLFHRKQSTLQGGEELLITTLAEKSLEKYVALKETPHFMDYLVDLSPMTFYGEANIGSRPSKRGEGKLTLQDLRAIPYVGAWSQLKQNVPGFYGVGTALEAMHKAGNFSELKALYKRSLFVKTLFDNCEMAMLKCFFPLTAHFANDKKYSAIWQMVFEEFELTKKYVLLLAGKKQLMEDYPVERLSISMRDRIVLPLSTIQQYSIGKLKETKTQKEKDVFKKLIVRCSFGIINAARNSV